jgi:signal transduction histidine kinase
MDNAVSVAGDIRRIQTTPEIPAKNGGVRTWPVFSLALLALLGLMLVPAVTALRRSEAIYDAVRADQEQFQDTQRVFESVSQNVFSISLTIREFLLDTSPDADRIYRQRLDDTQDQLQADMTRLGRRLPPDGRTILDTLRRQVSDYVEVVQSMLDWTAEERVARGAYFLRQEQRPRRDTILAMAQQLSQLNASIYAQQQQRTNVSERRFRAELQESVLFALLAGIVVSTGGILRLRWLERRAAVEREREIETTQEIRMLSARLRHAQEEERRTISRELHDDVGQKLTAMRMELGTVERLRDGDRGEFDVRVAELKALTEQTLHVIRDIAAGLRPAVLDDLGLPAAVQKQAREFAKRTGVSVSVSADGFLEQVRDPHRTYIYRIVQEALTNCARHSHAAKIAMTLVGREDRVELTVLDDGVGFDQARVRHVAGLGLMGMEERVRELGGTAAIQSSPGHGTAIRVTIPLQSHGGNPGTPR